MQTTTTLTNQPLQVLFQLIEQHEARPEQVNSLEEVFILTKRELQDIKLERCRGKSFRTQQEHFDYVYKALMWYVECCQKGLHAA